MLHCDQGDSTLVAHTLGCRIADLPLTYLGIPLTVRKPTCAQLQPLVDRVVAQLPCWKSRLMNKSGRLVLVKSVLCAIPIHQLLVFAPPKRITKQLEKIQRSFLWEARAAANGRNCHVNWRRVCRPLSLGGLGVQDIESRACAAIEMAVVQQDGDWASLGWP